MKYVLLLSVLVFYQYSFGQDSFTKGEYKELKKSLPEGLIVKPDYFEKYVYVSTGNIVFNGKRPRFFDEPRTSHTWSYSYHYNDGKWIRSKDILYVFEYRSNNWLFVERLDVLLSNSGKEANRGIGEHIEIDLTESRNSREVRSGGKIVEYYYTTDKNCTRWIQEVARYGYYSKTKVIGKDSYDWAIIRGSNFQKTAIQFVNSLNFHLTD